VLEELYMCWRGLELKCVGSTVHVLERVGTKKCWKYCTCAGEGWN